MIRRLLTSLHIAHAKWHASGSTSEIERLRALRYDAIRLPASECNRKRIATLDQLIEIEVGNAQKQEQRIAALGAL